MKSLLMVIVIIAAVILFIFVYVPYMNRKEMEERRRKFMERAYWEEELKFMSDAERFKNGFPAKKK